MKKILAITLIMAMVLTGCNSTPDSNNNTTKTHTITEFTTEGKETKLISDETAIGELTISRYMSYDPNDPQDYYNIAIGMFNELYPNVKVNLDIPDLNVTYQQYLDRMLAEIMGGSGPDIFWLLGDPQDPYKLMKSGALADLTPYIENDTGFNIDDFNKSVFYEGQLNGKQYIIPMGYHLPLMLTTQSIIDEIGLDISKCKDYISCGEEIARVVKENKLGLNKENIITEFSIPFFTPLCSGVDWLDFENGKVDLSSPKIEKMFGFIKGSYMDSVEHYNPYDRHTGNVSRHDALLNKKTMMADVTQNGFGNLEVSSRIIYGEGETPVVFPWRDVNGKISAAAFEAACVSQSSKNVENAYRFLKLLMSQEFFTELGRSSWVYTVIPINNNVSRLYFERGTDKDIIFEGETGKTIQLKKLPQEFIDTYMGYINDVESASLDPLAGYTFRETMKPYVDGEKTYEECIKEAQTKLDIYISE